jgi:glycosyltransferase involved in cell wall biosynthesis
VTTRKLPLSCFIIARNEADRIGRTIDSVSAFVDEVIVID